MNKENTLKLYQAFPSIFLREVPKEEVERRAKNEFVAEESKIDFDGKMARLHYGFECGDGWFDLIFGLCENISHLARIHDLSPVIAQVKEKFGSLRFYLQFPDDIKVVDEGDGCGQGAVIERKPGVEAIYRLIEEAGQKSASVCEMCGAPGTMRRDSWHHVACDPCESARRSR